ncbi:membrane protein [Wobbly possum disease virus]|uniref:Membrane protein n=1 Tax=Wobbly possum disease virus TaxID=1118369 RepID=G9FGS4_9NIDO|nr:membrane protein [Wobbly possum disease virus]AEU12354.1 membrane protein [Wobbly possum disease virus]
MSDSYNICHIYANGTSADFWLGYAFDTIIVAQPMLLVLAGLITWKMFRLIVTPVLTLLTLYLLGFEVYITIKSGLQRSQGVIALCLAIFTLTGVLLLYVRNFCLTFRHVGLRAACTGITYLLHKDGSTSKVASEWPILVETHGTQRTANGTHWPPTSKLYHAGTEIRGDTGQAIRISKLR